MSERQDPTAAAQEDDDNLSPEELEEVAGGQIDTNSGVCNGNCPCNPGG